VGRRVAEIAQLRGLRHLDVFLAGDLAAMKRLTTRCPATEPPKQSEIRQLSERWRLWRSLAFVREPPVTQRGGSSQIW
jgi:3-methyladenine DNA glycosylase/8-oxoguanine DNA glycosylase